MVFVCDNCKKQFRIRIGKSPLKELRKNENFTEEMTETDFGSIIVVENVFGFKQVFPLHEGNNVFGRKCIGTSINCAIESSDPSMDRVHCIVNVRRNKQGEPVYTLQDAPSITGTFYMNNILGDKDRVRMSDGAIITIGATTLILNQNSNDEAKETNQ